MSTAVFSVCELVSAVKIPVTYLQHGDCPEDGPFQPTGIRLLAEGGQAVDEIAAAFGLPGAALTRDHDTLADLPVQQCTEGHVCYGKYMWAQLAQRLVLVHLNILGVVVERQELIGVDGDEDVADVGVDFVLVEALAQSLQDTLLGHSSEVAEVIVVLPVALELGACMIL